MTRANGASNGHNKGSRTSPNNASNMKDKPARRRALCLNVRVTCSSPLFLVITTALACGVAFICGTAYRVFILQPRSYGLSVMEGIYIYKSGMIIYNGKANNDGYLSASSSLDRPRKVLPAPRLHDGKAMPQTRYTGKAFPEDGKGRDSVRSSHDLHIQPSQPHNTCAAQGTSSGGNDADIDDANASTDTDTQCRAPISANNSNDNDTTESSSSSSESSPSPPPPLIDDNEEHLPAGQHLLVDIKNVDSDFLDSEERLAEAMVEVVSLSQLTLLSYHCHSLIPKGVSCVGVLLESHISFHTWPDEGVITLDLFTCGSGLLVPVVPIIERLFGVPQEGAGQYIPPDADGVTNDTYVPQEEDYIEPPRMVWSHVLRGFRPEIKNGWRPLEADISETVLGRLEMDYKKVIATTVTEYQQIDVVDVINPGHGNIRSYERSLRSEIDTYESAHPELYHPNRMVFLDGVIQSTSRGDEAYHEALVHPAMFAHFEPKRVAIIGGGEGATLREVLKHRTLEEVKMIEIDEIMVNASREFLPGWSDCSDLEGSTPSCFDDPRTDLRCEDALAWFIDRFSDEAADDSSDDEEDDDDDDDEELEDKEVVDVDDVPFDVIIMDALDPQDNIEFADALYNNDIFLDSLYQALTDNGVLVLQLGESPGGSDASEKCSGNHNRHRIMSMIEDVGFQSMHIYEESHCGFGYPWSFLVACKSEQCRYNWYMNEAEKDMEIQYRILPTRSGESPLHYFDGATMRGYQNPPKSWETVYCRQEPTPEYCNEYRGYNKRTENYSIDKFEVRMSSIGDGAGRGVFAKVDVPKGSFIAGEQSSKKVHFSHTTTEFIENLRQRVPENEDLGDLLRYAYGYGFQQKTVANYEYYVDSGILTFVNHGCNGTNNIGDGADDEGDSAYFNEATVDMSKIETPPCHLGRHSVFDPVVDRHLSSLATGHDKSSRDIKAGEELFQNYMYFISWAKDWKREILDLQAQCRGEVRGQIREDEIEALEEEEDSSDDSEDEE